MLWNVQMNVRIKIAVAAVLSLGILYVSVLSSPLSADFQFLIISSASSMVTYPSPQCIFDRIREALLPEQLWQTR
jgi:hypothetical protein